LEVDQLRAHLADQKSLYKTVSNDMIAVQASSKARSAMRLLPAEAAYLLTVEIQHPIEFVVLQSSVDLLLLDVDSNVAILSRSPPDPKNGNQVLATYRCQDANTIRLDIKVRPIEGRVGEVHAYVVPKMAPKTCQCVNFSLKPLALHEKVASGSNTGNRPVTTLKINGDFTLNDIHTWASCVLPELPPRLSTDEGKFDFHSTFLDTALTVEYKRGFATFVSDNPSTISIVKEVLTREATNAKAQISINLGTRALAF
jgi:Bardet-Biedl syndrome 7 protein